MALIVRAGLARKSKALTIEKNVKDKKKEKRKLDEFCNSNPNRDLKNAFAYPTFHARTN